MSTDFFDRLTDPRQDSDKFEFPDESARKLYEEFSPALHLLRQGAPQNGVNLVPRWEQFLTEQAAYPADQLRTKASVRQFFFPAARLAAVLLIGLIVGGVLGGTLVDHLSSPSDTNTAGCQYSMEQLQTMFVVLGDDQVDAKTVRLQQASVQLAACITCHNSALRPRLSQSNVSARLPKIQ